MDVLRNQSELSGYFADCLIDQKYAASLDESSYESIRLELVERINRSISQVVFDNLTDDQLEELEGFLEEGDGAGASDFLRTAIPDLRRLIVERLVALKEEITN
jgi:hypothetical protein